MMVRWVCGVSVKDSKQSEILYSLLVIQSVAEVVRHGRLRWFGHLERKSAQEDWVLASRNLEVVGEKCRGGARSSPSRQVLCI